MTEPQPRIQETQPKRALDRRVAELLGRNVTEISSVTEAFLHEVLEALVRGDEVQLDGLGILYVQVQQLNKTVLLTNVARRDGTKDVVTSHVRQKYYVKFRKSTRLRDAIRARYGGAKTVRRVTMEKYGVDESVDGEDLEKKAADGCPKCGAKPTRHGNTLICAKCGSEPFEQKK